MTIERFTIVVAPTVLDDLQRRPANTRWPDEVTGAGWDYGTNLAHLKELTRYWQHDFDWRTQETLLNRFAQFRAEIDGIGIHFIHERGVGPNRCRSCSCMAGPTHSTASIKSSPC